MPSEDDLRPRFLMQRELDQMETELGQTERERDELRQAVREFWDAEAAWSAMWAAHKDNPAVMQSEFEAVKGRLEAAEARLREVVKDG